MYKSVNGDTFEIISRKIYFNEKNIELLKKANPNIEEPIPVGTNIITPIDVAKKQDNIINESEIGQNDITILIDGAIFKYFTDISIRRSIDSIDTLIFTAPMESDNIDFINIFKPFTYKEVVVFVGTEQIFNGTIINISPSVGQDSKIITVDCYARCGVLNDCTASPTQYPLEFVNSSLFTIANTLLKPFGLLAIFEDLIGATFEQVSIKPNEKILPFLTKLASERNLLISSNSDGNVVFKKPSLSNDIKARVQEGISPLISISASFSSQEYYSHISGLEVVDTGGNGSSFTLKNDRLNIFRPITFEVEDTTTGDIRDAVESKMGRMFGNMVSYSLEMASVRDGFNNLWTPNTLINVLSPNNMIYNEYTFLIRDVELIFGQNSSTAILDIVIPQSFSGKIPEVLPWD